MRYRMVLSKKNSLDTVMRLVESITSTSVFSSTLVSIDGDAKLTEVATGKDVIGVWAVEFDCSNGFSLLCIKRFFELQEFVSPPDDEWTFLK